MQIKLPDFEVQITQEHINDGEPLRSAVMMAPHLNFSDIIIGTIHIWVYASNEDDFARYIIGSSLKAWYEDFFDGLADPITVIFSGHLVWVKEE
jgi:hypothetical protein